MSTFNDRSEFINAASSEKITLATIEAKKRLYVWVNVGGGIYSKVVPNFVTKLKQDDQELNEFNSLVGLPEGYFYYEVKTSTLYAHFNGSVAPNTVEVIATYKLFYSNKGTSLAHDLSSSADEVHWDGRITASPGYKHKIGIDQALTSLVGEGTLSLQNNDAGLDQIFDDYIFENQSVVIYSWNPSLPTHQSKVIYRGSITNKSYNGSIVTFKIKDLIFTLLDAPSLSPYTNDDNVAESVKGQYKRRVYGRVDGLRSQSIDQISTGFPLSGTGSMPANGSIILGQGTSFLNEIVQGDTVIIGTQEFTVQSVDSDTQISVDDESEFSFSGQNMLLNPERGSTLRNRNFISAGHVCAKVTHQVVEALQFNRIKLNSTSGLFPGDFVEFDATGERIEIKNIAPGNIVVLQQNVVLKPNIGSDVIRQPVQEVYINGIKVNSDDFSVFNTSSGCGITFNDIAEFNLARPRNTVFSANFTNGSREITVSTSEISLDEVFQPGDFVKPDDSNYTQFYKINHLTESSIFISENFAQPSIVDIVEIKSPNYLNDSSIVSVNILGKTEDGTESGVWIQTAAQATRDLLNDINIDTVNEQSFLDASEDANQLVSVAIPFDFNSKSLPTVKALTDSLNKSIHGSLTLDNDLQIKYQVLNVYSGETLPVIRDSDVKNWKIKTTNGKTYKTALVKYRHTDTDLSTLEDGNKFVSFESEFVSRYIGTNKVDELDIYLYEDRDAEISAHRHLYYNSLSVATATLETDLRLENIEIGQVVIVEFERLYRRKGDSVRKKTMLVSGKTVTGEQTQLELSDLGNTFNTSSYITPNDAEDWSMASSDDKLIYGYITDNQGIVNDEEDTAGTHLIS